MRATFLGISTLEIDINLAIGNILLSAFTIFQGYCSPYKVKQNNMNELVLLFNLLGF